MSIIVLNDLVLKETEEGNKINNEICLFYLLLNLTSFICCSSYLFIYHKIPYYQNNSNSLTLILTRVNLVSSFSYVLFFSDLLYYNPVGLTPMIKLLTMINPLIIFTFYFWCGCITHNIYVTFYNYTNSLEKRIKFYKYQLIVYLFIFYICTLFSIKFKETQIKSPNFSFIDNYGVHYIILFYLIGLFMIIYIISRIFFIIKKKTQTFSLTSPNEGTLIIKKLFQSLVARHIMFISYFLITFIPINFMMILKYIFRIVELRNFYLSFITMTLLSFYGVFIFIIKLTEPIIRHFFLSYLLCNKKFTKEYEPLMKKDNPNLSNEDLTESCIDGGERNILMNAYREYDKSFVTYYNLRQMQNLSVLQRNKFTSFNLENKYVLRFMQGEKKEINKFYSKNLKTMSMKNIKSLNQENKTKHLFHDSTVNVIEMRYYQDEGENNNENNINIAINIVKNENEGKNDNNNNNKNKDNKKTLNLKESKASIDTFEGDISFKGKEEKIPSKELISEERKKSNQIKNELPIKNNNQIRTMSLGNHSKITTKGLSSNKKESKFHSNNNTQINERNSSTLEFDQILYSKKNTDTTGRMPKKCTTNISRTNTRVSSIDIKNLHRSPKKDKHISKKFRHFFEEEISGYELLNYHLEKNDNLQRMMAISLCINKDRIYDNQNKYQQYYYSPLPWKNNYFYKQETHFNKYNEKNFPDFLDIKNDPRFNGIEFKVKEYSPFVFHHIRLLDKLSIDDVLRSLDVKNNLEIINDSKVTGGRGNNSMFRSWDKKLIIKTINDDEKELLINKMLEEYHCKMRDAKCILARIYGVFTIELADKGISHVMLQRNMNDLFCDSNILTFDLKGSTEDRQIIKKENIKLPQSELIKIYKNVTLKDNDLKIIGIKLELNHFDAETILNSIYNDSMYLQKYDITDYSLLVFVNKYNKKNLEKRVGNINIISEVNKKYIFNFSIIDFLGTFDLGKKSEKVMKEIIYVFRSSNNKNFSVQNPQNYGARFRKNAKKIIIYEKEENDNDNFSS